MATTISVIDPHEPLHQDAPPSYKSLFGNQLSSNKISEEYFYFKNTDDVPNPPKKVPARKELPKGSKVCIIGAGMAGLYLAMILDALEVPNLSYEILEASNRTGGRVYTHKFSDKLHDYYDVGAMRFPKIPIMDKTFALFTKMGTPLREYIMHCDTQPARYNDKTVIGSYSGKDTFQVSSQNGGLIPSELVIEADKYLTEAFEPFKSRLRENWKKGFNALMKYDNFSVRGFMMSHGITPLDDYYSIQWLETLTDGSGLYDQGFSEGVIDQMDFDYYTEYLHPKDDKYKVEWYCVEGGTSLLPEAMAKSLKAPLTKENFNKRVTKIAYNREEGVEKLLEVKIHGETAAREYLSVFNTTTLACLQRMDLTELGLLYEQKDAIRSLHYDTASKVGMKFKKAWWIEYGIKGGLGKTDLPLRTCVYPSYNVGDPVGKEAVLLCSYSWAQDAARIGSLMKGNPKDEDELKDMLFDNLAWLHIEHARQKDPKITFDDFRAEIADLYITHHAFDWHNDPFSSGAYGKFGPGQFANLYPALLCPVADSRFHFVGEAVSAHHGWIVGALDSAHRTVINFLRNFGLYEFEEKLKTFEWLGPPPDEVSEQTSWRQVLLGRIHPDERLAARVAIEKAKEGTQLVVPGEKHTI